MFYRSGWLRCVGLKCIGISGSVFWGLTYGILLYYTNIIILISYTILFYLLFSPSPIPLLVSYPFPSSSFPVQYSVLVKGCSCWWKVWWLEWKSSVRLRILVFLRKVRYSSRLGLCYFSLLFPFLAPVCSTLSFLTSFPLTSFHSPSYSSHSFYTCRCLFFDTYIPASQQFWPRMFYRSGWLRCDVFNLYSEVLWCLSWCDGFGWMSYWNSVRCLERLTYRVILYILYYILLLLYTYIYIHILLLYIIYYTLLIFLLFLILLSLYLLSQDIYERYTHLSKVLRNPSSNHPSQLFFHPHSYVQY